MWYVESNTSFFCRWAIEQEKVCLRKNDGLIDSRVYYAPVQAILKSVLSLQRLCAPFSSPLDLGIEASGDWLAMGLADGSDLPGDQVMP